MAPARVARISPGRDAGRAMERAHEIREVAEPHVERDVGDRARSSSASRRAAWRSRERTRYWCGVTPSTPENSRRKWNGLRPASPRRALEIDRLVRVRVDPERGLDRAPPVACARPSGSALCARRRARRSAPRAAMPTSSRPTSLAPSAAACASSPSTISSGSGGTPPVRQTSGRPPIASTSSGASWNDRHSSPSRDRACTGTRRRDGRPGSTRPRARTTSPRER